MQVILFILLSLYVIQFLCICSIQSTFDSFLNTRVALDYVGTYLVKSSILVYIILVIILF